MKLFRDVRLVLRDGTLQSHRLLLAGVSPLLRRLLQEGEDDEDESCISLPDVSKHLMSLLLNLLTTGRAQLSQNEVPDLVSLTHLLKLSSIPVAVVAEESEGDAEKRNQSLSILPRAVITFIPSSGTTRGRPAKPSSSVHTEKASKSGELAQRREEKEGIGVHEVQVPSSALPVDAIEVEIGQRWAKDSAEEEADSGEDVVEEMEVTVSVEGRVERVEKVNAADLKGEAFQAFDDFHLDEQRGRSANNKPGAAEEKVITREERLKKRDRQPGLASVQGDEGEGLDNLISVAEAFEKSQQPDFNDIASPVVDGTDTDRHLVRTCVICNKALLGRNALGRHMKNVHPKVFGPYRCNQPGCGKMIESGAKMVAHHSSQHTGGATKLAQAKPSFQCSVAGCEGTFASGGRLAEHMRRKHEMNDCGPQRLAFPCNAGVEHCTQVFTTARAFIRHMKDEHGMKPWLCGPCDKRFMERQNLQFHLMSHGDQRNFACDICNKSFSNPRQLYTHRALHLGRRFLCQECGYRARSSANLRGHVRSKHEQRTHTCNLCSKKFSSGNNLRNHQRIHTGEAPYECELCGVKFKRMHHLHSHIESKMHLDIMEKCRRKGHSIPPRLDPIRRARGRPVVEDGPVTLVSQAQVEGTEWAATQVVVVEESVGDFIIPVEETQEIEIGSPGGVLQEATYTFV